MSGISSYGGVVPTQTQNLETQTLRVPDDKVEQIEEGALVDLPNELILGLADWVQFPQSQQLAMTCKRIYELTLPTTVSLWQQHWSYVVECITQAPYSNCREDLLKLINCSGMEFHENQLKSQLIIGEIVQNRLVRGNWPVTPVDTGSKLTKNMRSFLEMLSVRATCWQGQWIGALPLDCVGFYVSSPKGDQQGYRIAWHALSPDLQALPTIQKYSLKDQSLCGRATDTLYLNLDYSSYEMIINQQNKKPAIEILFPLLQGPHKNSILQEILNGPDPVNQYVAVQCLLVNPTKQDFHNAVKISRKITHEGIRSLANHAIGQTALMYGWIPIVDQITNTPEKEAEHHKWLMQCFDRYLEEGNIIAAQSLLSEAHNAEVHNEMYEQVVERTQLKVHLWIGALELNPVFELICQLPTSPFKLQVQQETSSMAQNLLQAQGLDLEHAFQLTQLILDPETRTAKQKELVTSVSQSLPQLIKEEQFEQAISLIGLVPVPEIQEPLWREIQPTLGMRINTLVEEEKLEQAFALTQLLAQHRVSASDVYQTVSYAFADQELYQTAEMVAGWIDDPYLQTEVLEYLARLQEPDDSEST